MVGVVQTESFTKKYKEKNKKTCMRDRCYISKQDSNTD